MKRHSSAVIEFSAAVPSSIKVETGHKAQNSMDGNNVSLETFTVRFAWAFASAVGLLIVVSLLLAVAGFAGSNFDPALQPKALPAAVTK